MLWLRGFGDGPPGPSADDSVNIGIDGTLPATSDRMGNGWVADNGLFGQTLRSKILQPASRSRALANTKSPSGCVRMDLSWTACS
jgi:hypothetical protein